MSRKVINHRTPAAKPPNTYYRLIDYYCCPVKIKTIKNQSKFLDNQVHDFDFQKVSPKLNWQSGWHSFCLDFLVLLYQDKSTKEK